MPVDFRQKRRRALPDFDVLRGTLDLLVLKTLTLEPMHRWGISQPLRQVSRGLPDVNQGSLSPALQCLEQRGRIEGEWRTTENNRRVRYYRLTVGRRSAAGAETTTWRRYVVAVELILGRAARSLRPEWRVTREKRFMTRRYRGRMARAHH